MKELYPYNGSTQYSLKKDFKSRLKKAGKVLTKGLKNRKSQIALQHLRKLNGIKEDTVMRKKDRLILG
jgi:hypothetical protein